MNSPEKILNMNEMAWSKSQNINSKYVVSMGSKHSFQGTTFILDHVTSVHCASAAGNLLPTMIIYKGCVPQWIQSEGLPSDWVVCSSESGFINGDLFFEWMKNVLVPYTKKQSPPHLLLMDHATPH